MASEEGINLEVPVVKAPVKHDPLPEGKYTIVSVDVDTTGKRLIDELVQVATYTPDKSHSQYIMPLMNLNPAARQRHQVRVITVGFFRMLKSMHTYKVMKTKTEVQALNALLEHLEQLKAADTDSKGVIMMFHEQRKFVPYMIIEAMKKYNLLARFMDTVKSFVNTYPVAVEKCGNPMKYFNLRQTAKVLTEPNPMPTANGGAEGEEAKADGAQEPGADDAEKKPHHAMERDVFEGNATTRAQLSYAIGQHLARGDANDLSPDQLKDKFMQLALSYAHSIDVEIEELKEQERILERQSSLRPIFLQYFRTTLHHRVKAVTYRRVLAELGYNLEALQALWTESKKDGMKTVTDKCEELKSEDREELVEILDHHFDPEKVPLKPRVNRRHSQHPPSSGNPNPQPNNNNNQNGNNGGRRRRNRARSIASSHGGMAFDQNNNANTGKQNKENMGNKNQQAAGDRNGGKGRPKRPFKNSRRNNRNGGLVAVN